MMEKMTNRTRNPTSSDDLDQDDLVKLAGGYVGTVVMTDVPTPTDLQQLYEDGEMTAEEAMNHPARPEDSSDELVLVRSGCNEFTTRPDNIRYILKYAEDRADEVTAISENFRLGDRVPADMLECPDGSHEDR